MQGRRRLRRPGTVVAGAAIAVVTVAGATACAVTPPGPGPGTPTVHVSVTLGYDCVFPLIGTQPLGVKIDADAPTEVETGVAMQPVAVDAVATVSTRAGVGLRSIGATTLGGTARADARVTAPNLDQPAAVDMDVAAAPIPATPGTFDVHATGATPQVTFTQQNVGTGTLTVGGLLLTMTPRDANGNPTGLGTFESECTLQPGQSTGLHTFRITRGGPLAYDAAGESFVKASNGTVPLAGHVDATLDRATGRFTADLALEPTEGQFTILGFFPVTAQVQFEPVGPTTGTLVDGRLTSRTELVVKVPSVLAFGFLPAGGGPDCRTATPAVVDLATPAGERFDPATGGNLSGTFTLPPLADCGAFNDLISQLTAGPGNTIDLALTPSAPAAAAAATSAPPADPVTGAPVEAAATSDPGFYVPPDPLPAGAPGDVIRARRSPAGPPSARAMADAWQVMYRSTDVAGQPNAVTGTVLVPKGHDPATVPLVGFGPGTHGPAFRCAASLQIEAGGFYEQSAVNDMLRRGYAVAVPDYEGYHPDPATTYMVGPSQGHALIDAVRAAQRLPEAGLADDAKVVFRGYSQGGGSAMWAGELEPTYAPELNLVGVAGGGVPADLLQVGAPLEGADAFGFFLYTIFGFDNAYADISLEASLTDTGRAELARMKDEVCALDLILDYQRRSIFDFVTTAPFDATWIAHLGESRLGTRPIQVPVFQYHEAQDGLVAFPQAQALRDAYCAQGVPLTWQTLDTQGATGLVRHINGVYRGNAAVDEFVAARFAGQPATSTC